MERRLGIMQSVEPVENAIKTLQNVVDVRGMGKARVNFEIIFIIFFSKFTQIFELKAQNPRKLGLE
jgi:hypothetical protein